MAFIGPMQPDCATERIDHPPLWGEGFPPIKSQSGMAAAAIVRVQKRWRANLDAEVASGRWRTNLEEEKLQKKLESARKRKQLQQQQQQQQQREPPSRDHDHEHEGFVRRLAELFKSFDNMNSNMNSVVYSDAAEDADPERRLSEDEDRRHCPKRVKRGSLTDPAAEAVEELALATTGGRGSGIKCIPKQVQLQVQAASQAPKMCARSALAALLAAWRVQSQPKTGRCTLMTTSTSRMMKAIGTRGTTRRRLM